MADEGKITVKGARVNNLKNVSLMIPREKFIVITGLSGSGKSSLAFDTLYAEGQRRYVESLSSYARQFLGRMSKPEVDYIKGLPPAIAIEQKVSTRNPRSTVGTSTEIYEYLKLLFARIGRTYSPVSGEEVRRHSVSDITDYIMSFSEGMKGMVMTPVEWGNGETEETYKKLVSEGYQRLWKRGVGVMRLGSDELPKEKTDGMYVVVDRFVVNNERDTMARLSDSVQTALQENPSQRCAVLLFENGDEILREFSTAFEADGIKFTEPSPLMFSFNSPYGACSKCGGFGKVMGIDEDLVVPNQSLSVYEGAVVCWRGEKMSEWLNEFCSVAAKIGFPIHIPYSKLTSEQKDILWHGKNGSICIDMFFDFVRSSQHKIQYRVMLARYNGKTVCPECGGSRLKKAANNVRIYGGKTIQSLVQMSVCDLQKYFDEIKLTEYEASVSNRLLVEIRSRLGFLADVGLGYLTLDRLSNSLSGGESQRINLATQLGSALVGSLYILDEPSIGLHSRDTQRLISVLRKLQKLGNTVVVVEHDEEIMREADYLIDIGSEAGINGGNVVYAGEVRDGLPVANKDTQLKSYTLDYLSGAEKIERPLVRRKWQNFVEIKGARHNNLKNIDVKFPLGVMTVVTGVSGSGKSSLVRDVLYKALKRDICDAEEKLGAFDGLSGALNLVGQVEFVDQSPIGRSTRSTPVTYIKAFDEIRKLYAEQLFSKQMGYRSAHFSFNASEGRCDECQGEGVITIEMQFMADLMITCESCGGKRYKKDILEVVYRDKNISDVLEMSVEEAIAFFGASKGSIERKIVEKLRSLESVGLGYVKLGQTSSTLSGGESQRVKLASILSDVNMKPSVFIFDEPTTGLHFHDIKVLLKALNALVANGHTVIVIEHNTDMIASADYVVDMGPEGGAEGGYVVFEGTPDELVKCEKSYTGRFMKGRI